MRGFEKPCDVLVAAIPGGLNQRVAPEPHMIRRRARVEQNANRVEVSSADGERERRRKVMTTSDEAWFLLEQDAQRSRVAAFSCGDDFGRVAHLLVTFPLLDRMVRETHTMNFPELYGRYARDVSPR